MNDLLGSGSAERFHELVELLKTKAVLLVAVGGVEDAVVQLHLNVAEHCTWQLKVLHLTLASILLAESIRIEIGLMLCHDDVAHQ